MLPKFLSFLLIAISAFYFTSCTSIREPKIHMANLESYLPILPVHVVRADDSSRIDFSASVSTSNNLTLIAKQTNDVNNTRLTLNNTIVDAQIDYVLAN